MTPAPNSTSSHWYDPGTGEWRNPFYILLTAILLLLTIAAVVLNGNGRYSSAWLTAYSDPNIDKQLHNEFAADAKATGLTAVQREGRRATIASMAYNVTATYETGGQTYQVPVHLDNDNLAPGLGETWIRLTGEGAEYRGQSSGHGTGGTAKALHHRSGQQLVAAALEAVRADLQAMRRINN